MKRFIAAAALMIGMVCLSGCGEPPELKESFELSFTVVQNEISYKGELSLSDGELSIEMQEPYTVKGMKFDYSDEGLEISYADHGTKAGSDYLPAGSIPAALHDTFAYISKAEYRSRSDGNDIYAVTTPYGEAIITAADGIPIALEDPYSGLSFGFYDHSD